MNRGVTEQAGAGMLEKKSPAAANQPGKSSEKKISQPASLANLKVSVVKHAQDTETRDCKVTSLLEMIRTGGKDLRKQIEAIRKTDDDELLERLKRKLPAVTCSGTFALRA